MINHKESPWTNMQTPTQTTPLSENSPAIHDIAVVRLSALGDIVHTVPAFDLLRKAFPFARICWFAEPAGAKLLKNIDGIDEVVTFNLKVKGFTRKLKKLRQVLASHRKTFDLVIDFQGLIKSAIFSRLLGKNTLGFGKSNLKESQARFFYRHTVGTFDECSHVIFKNIHLIRGLLDDDAPDIYGPPLKAGKQLAYPLKEIPLSLHLDQFFQQNRLEPGRYIIINIGGGWETKTLSEQQYVEIIHGLHEKYDEKIVVLWGNRKEEERAREISRQTQAIMSVFLDFGELISFIRGARCVITADTLALHVADMVETPSIAFFGPTSPLRNGSLLPYSISVQEKLTCGFCYKKKCGKIDCIKKLNIQKIIEAVETIHEKRS